ncbi:MAG: hypothetical protein RI883_1474 [Bacteroidota bacterium]|jgi:3-hydroxyacyl-[acyl-carrier-protein] dehydratase
MKLLDSFFTLVDSSTTPTGYSCKVTLDPTHIVYKGHFPGFPVTPGVIQIQLIHELLEYFSGKKYRLLEITDCKFLTIINPEKVQKLEVIIDVNITTDELKLNAQINDDSVGYFKCRSSYILKALF